MNLSDVLALILLAGVSLCASAAPLTPEEAAGKRLYRQGLSARGEAIMARVGNDENLHYLFYRDLTTAAIAVDPSNMIIGIERAVRTFAMPGTGIPDFERLSREIARVGIYDLLIHHDQILQPVVMRHWKLDQTTGLTDEAEKAREALFKRIERIGKVGAKMASDRVSA